MSKSTELGQLANLWLRNQYAIHQKTLAAAGGPYSPKWDRIVSCHRNKVNTGGRCKNRAYKVAHKLSELQFWAEIIRRNRKLSGLPPQVFRFGNSGRATS